MDIKGGLLELYHCPARCNDEVLLLPIQMSEKAAATRLLTRMRTYHAETASHMMRVGAICAVLAARSGLPAWHCEAILWAATLHDIGKLKIPESILAKPSALTESELSAIQQHSHEGAAMLTELGAGFWGSAAQFAQNHHEYMDGSGYPRGLVGTRIPYAVRLCVVSDVFDALRSARSYKNAMLTPGAICWMRDTHRKRFDTTAIDLLHVQIVEVERIRAFVDDLMQVAADGNAGTHAVMMTLTERLTRDMPNAAAY